MGRDHHSRIEIIIGIAQSHLNEVAVATYAARWRSRHQVPLLGSLVQTDGTTLHRSDTVVDDLDTGVLLVVETAREGITEDQHIHTLGLEIFLVVEYQVIGFFLRLVAGRQRQRCQAHQYETFFHNSMY